MCKVSVNVNEATLQGLNPSLNSPAAISQWVQQLVDLTVREMMVDCETMDIEEARALVHEAIREEYARP